MKKLEIFNILIYIIIILSYTSVTFYRYASEINAILALLVLGISIVWIMFTNKGIKISRVFLFIISISMIFITKKTNLISLALLSTLCIIADNIKHGVNIKLYLRLTSLCFIMTILAYVIVGFNKDLDMSIWRVASQSIIDRSSLGFEHPNQAMFKWYGIALGLLSLCNKNNIYKISFGVFFMTLIIYNYTVSRTSMIMILMTIFLLIVYKHKLEKKISKNINRLIASMPIIYTIISYLSIYLSKFDYINDLFSGRFVLYNSYVKLAGFNWFGNEFIENQSMLDNSYLHMILSKGLVFYISYVLFMYILITRIKDLRVRDAIILFAYFTSGLTETILFKFDLILLVIIILYRKKAMEENFTCKV